MVIPKELLVDKKKTKKILPIFFLLRNGIFIIALSYRKLGNLEAILFGSLTLKIKRGQRKPPSYLILHSYLKG
jgi:hypothetical protein